MTTETQTSTFLDGINFDADRSVVVTHKQTSNNLATLNNELKATSSNMWQYIPPSLMNEKVWLLGCDTDNAFEPGKRPHYLNYNHVPVPASIKVPTHYMTYDEAVSYADENNLNLGFVHTTDLGICTLDADFKDDTPEDVKQRVLRTFYELDSYVEYSNSGKGFHCLLRTEKLISLHPSYPSVSPIPLEVYSYNRFMLTTGREVRLVDALDSNGNPYINVIELSEHEYDDIYRKVPSYREELLQSIVEQLGGTEKEFEELVEIESNLSDEEVMRLIEEDYHGTQFSELGSLPHDFEFQKVGYPSCSEVDLFLIGIIAKHSVSNEQVRRLFRQLHISKRNKHSEGKDYHINKALIKIRSDMACKLALAKETELAMENFIANINNRVNYEREAVKYQESADKLQLEQYNPTNDFEHQIPFPKGVAGEMCQYLMDIAPHKLPEAALAGTLATLSAIMGRQFQHNGAGLNNYYVVVAPSATGKETARRGVGRFAAATASVGGDKFFCFDTIASKQAYLSLFSESDTLSQLVFVPEFSKYVSAMKQKQNNVMQMIYSFWLEIFPRSAKGDVNGGNKRANSDESTAGVFSPALTLLCDTTGDDYYEQITEQMQRDGFMSRFVNIECYNPIKKLSDTECHKVTMPKSIVEFLTDLSNYVLKLNSMGEEGFIDVQIEPTIRKHIRSFELYTLEMVNKTRDEKYRQPYNRCFLKIMTIASILAVCRNMYNPIINMNDFEWAKSLIMRDVYNITRKLDNGTFGSSDENNEKLVKHEIRRILFKGTRTEVENVKYGMLLDKGIVPRSALTVRINNYSNFGRQNMAKVEVFDRIMFNFEKNGWIRRIDKSNRVVEFKALGYDEPPFWGDCYALQNGDVFAPSSKSEDKLIGDGTGAVTVEDNEFYEMELPTLEVPERKRPGRKPKTATQGN
jgi:hypothetical protein